MWIDINLDLPPSNHADTMRYVAVVNASKIESLQRLDTTVMHINFQSRCDRITSTKVAIDAVWNAIQIALCGQEVSLDEWGYIRPLIHEQRESLYKYMLYQETIGRMGKDIG